MIFLFKHLVQYGARARIGKLLAALLVVNLTFGQAAAAPVTVLAFGDSLTQGYGLPDGDGLVPQLQAWLTAQGLDATLINGGVSGDTTAGGLARIDWSLTPDIQAVIVGLGGNDVLRGLDPGESRKNLDGILRAISQKNLPILLIGMDAPDNYGADYKAKFDAIYPDLAQEYATPLFPVYLGPVLEGRSFAQALPLYMQADGIHPNKAGVALIVGKLGPMVADLIRSVK